MDDPQRKPGDSDRSALVARIRSAADKGLISAADRDIRLANAASAQTMTELDLMGRDLDQLEATLPATPITVSARSFGWVTVVVVVLVLVGGGATALIGFRSSDDDSSGSTGGLFSPEPIPTEVTEGGGPGGGPGGGSSDEPGDEPSASTSGVSPGSGTAYALTVPGIRSFLDAYRAKFGTTHVVDLTLYGDYAIVDVPQPNDRHAGHLYRGGDWQDFGGVTANFPGAQVVDLRRLDVQALARNIAKARRTLGVEKPTTTYAIVRYYSSSDQVPSVDVHVANKFGESGYLATTLDGTIERAYPYGDVQ